ncbi:MAG TPA: dihydrolipoamide acetyltransferase family protein [Solirubrobacteraceae bacterium]|jgi:pyruvate dehydrogenase E2 component (dihydrolipoamide acetyltransferase)
MAEIVMPRLSDTMEEGTILRWLKRDGELLARGEELVEIETDKAAMVYESDEQGVLEIVAGEGETLAVGEPIAHVGERVPAADSQPAEVEATPSAPPQASTSPPTASAPSPSSTPSPSPAPTPSPPPPTPEATTAPQADERVKASPVARRVARERGVDLHDVDGSGPGGRIVKADVEATATGGPGAAPPTSGATATAKPGGTQMAPATLADRVATAKGETTIVELTRTQQTIARRMAESKATIPDFALQMEIDMEACVALRAELKRLSPEEAPTYNDMIVKACALALREHPRANGSYRDGKLQLHARVNVGIAVASDDALVVPTVFDADVKSLGEIAREARALAERVRAGTITPPELGGGTFTVSNLGMYGIRSFTAIVNPPQAAILSVGALAPRAVVRDGELVARDTLILTLVCDHRVLYGADAARLLARVRELLEQPAALTL